MSFVYRLVLKAENHSVIVSLFAVAVISAFRCLEKMYIFDIKTLLLEGKLYIPKSYISSSYVSLFCLRQGGVSYSLEHSM